MAVEKDMGVLNNLRYMAGRDEEGAQGQPQFGKVLSDSCRINIFL
jgi:hypothetical protein